MDGTNNGCTPIQLFYNYYTANSRIYYNILYEQLIFVRITAIGCTLQIYTTTLQLFYILKDVLLQPMDVTTNGCTPIQLFYN